LLSRYCYSHQLYRRSFRATHNEITKSKVILPNRYKPTQKNVGYIWRGGSESDSRSFP
jgi:hypothetical protein